MASVVCLWIRKPAFRVGKTALCTCAACREQIDVVSGPFPARRMLPWPPDACCGRSRAGAGRRVRSSSVASHASVTGTPRTSGCVPSLSLSLSLPPPGRSAGEGLARPSEAPEISAEADATCAEKRVRRKRTRRLRGIVTCPVCVVPYVNCQQEVDCASTGGTASELTASGRNPPSSRPTQAFAYYSGRYGAELTWTGNRG